MKSYSRGLAVVFLLVFFRTFAWGNEFSVSPSISVKEEYNSNVMLSSDGVKRDFVTIISPGIEMVNRTYRLDTDLSLRLDRLEYSGNPGLSATNQMHSGKISYLASPRLRISAEAGYMRNSNPTLDIGKTGIFLAAVPWNRITSSLSVDYRYDEKTAVAVSYGYGRDYYANPMFVDDVSHDVNAGLVSDLGEYFPSVKAIVNAGYSKYSFPDSRIDSVMGDGGFSWDYNETVSVLVDGGVRRTWSEVSAARLKSAGLGWTGKVSLNYNGERGSGELAYTRDVAPAYGFNGAAESDALTLSVQNMFTNEVSSFFTAGYNALKSVSEFSARAINKHIFRVNPGVRYEFSKDMAAEASYEYTMIDYQALATQANRHIFSLRLYIQHSFLD